ncbi:MAG: acetoin utilization protein AcuC, partial [Candidatus Thermoplasmatota archaeon]
MPTALIYSDELMKYELSKEHPLNQIRLKLTYELIRSYGMLSNLFLYNPNYADEEKILLAHDKDYVDYVKEKSKSPEEDFLSSIYCLGTGDNPIFPGMYEASSLHVGGTILACELVLDRKAEHSFFLGGGFHHAKKSNAWGFCIFNDIVIAIKYIKRKYGLKKIMYLDIDAHHCDGVQEAFYSDPTVLKVSFHESGETLFPGTG